MSPQLRALTIFQAGTEACRCLSPVPVLFSSELSPDLHSFLSLGGKQLLLFRQSPLVSTFLSQKMSLDRSNMPGTPIERIGFRYSWTPKVTKRAVSAEEQVVLLVSPKFATVHDHVSFQWNLKVHGTTGSVSLLSACPYSKRFSSARLRKT